ncbi:MAG TPA: hypothetical protein VIH10_11245, partial [Kribbella sp.]
MSNQSNYDQRVKDILDRVAKGHLSPEEATTLIAAITTTPSEAAPSEAAEPAAEAPVADEPSPSVWAEAVDSPTAEPAVPPTASPTVSPSAEPTVPPVPEPSVVQDTVVDEAPADVEEVQDVEEEHSNVPIPSGVQRVTVRAIGRRVRLIGEPAVNGVAVDGPHVIKRDGDTLAISSEGDMGVSIDGFSMLRNPTDLKAHVNGLAKELSIRVNPNLQVEVEVTGGSVNAERLPGLTRVRVTAGTAKVTDV